MNVERDERTIAVENAGYRWAYLLLSYALIVDTAYRGYFRHEQAWDLLGLVIAGGAIGAIYQFRHQVLTPRCIKTALMATGIAAIVAAILALTKR